MSEIQFKQRLTEGTQVIGTFIMDIHSPFIMQVLAASGLDFAVIDMEHGTFGLPEVSTLCQVGRLCGLSPLVRVAASEYQLIAPVLDAGARGIVLPRVNSAEQVSEVVSWMRYLPDGQRGYGGTRGSCNYSPSSAADVAESAKQNILVVMIETTEGVKHLDEIISVPGIDVAMIGPGDLCVSLGEADQDDRPGVEQVALRVQQSCQQHGVAFGYVCGEVDVLKEWRDRGANFLCYGADVGLLGRVYRQAVKELKCL